MDYTEEELLRQRDLVEQQLQWIEEKLADHRSKSSPQVPPLPKENAQSPAPWEEPVKAEPLQAPPTTPDSAAAAGASPTPAPWEQAHAQPTANLDSDLPSGLRSSTLLGELKGSSATASYPAGDPAGGISSGQKLGCFIIVAIICLGVLSILFLLPNLLY